MRIKAFIVSQLVILLLTPCFSQETYQVGFSSVSLEPDDRFVSLALAGYAAPWEGRFSLQWKEQGTIPHYLDVTGTNNHLYCVDGKTLLRSTTDISSWEKICDSPGIRYIAGWSDKLIGVDDEGKLMKLDLSDRKFKWKKMGRWSNSIHAIAVAGGHLYLVDENGLFYVSDLGRRKMKWKKAFFHPLPNIVSLTGDDDKLIALTSDGVLYRQGGNYQQGKWIKIGYKNDITVKEDIKSITLAGNQFYGIDSNNRLFTGEHRSRQELTATALSIASGGKAVVVVALDLTGINDTFTALVKEELHKNRGLSPSAIFINSSHTHFAPVTQNWPTWQESNRIADSTYLYTFVREAIVKAVEESLDTAKPAELYIGRGQADLGYNRSLRDRPDLYDNAVDVLRFRYPDDKSEGLLFMAACHPVFSDAEERFTLSANFPGVARKIIKDTKGISRTMFLQGTAGDINPLDSPEFVTGEKLANEVMEVIDGSMQRVTGSLSHYLDTVTLEVPIRSKEDIIAYSHDAKINENGMLKERNHTWEQIMLGYLNKGMKQFPMPVYVHTLNIGNWKLVGFSRETTTPYGLRVKEMWPDRMVSVAGYTNDVSSYLPTRLHIEKRNYEGMDSFYWYGMPDTYPYDVEEKILSEIKKNNR
jgi:hypothetical protein